MKYLLLLALCMVILSGCGQSASGPETAVSTAGWTSYSNAKFGFSLKTPASWPRGQEMSGGEGVSLYAGNPEITIRAYALSNKNDISGDPYASGMKPGFQMHKIKVDKGKSAALIIGDTKNKVSYEMICINNDVQYHFYALVPEQFFNENEAVLQRIAQNFQF